MSFGVELKMPGGDQGQKTRAWLSLTAVLFPSVQDALDKQASLDFVRLRRDLETWRSFFTPDDKRRSQWEAAGRLLWCAEHALQVSGVDRGQMNQLLGNHHSPFITEHAGWVWNCTCLLKKLHVQETSVSVPVALSDENNSSLKAVGTIAKLVLDVLRPGTGQLFHHPEDSISASTSDDFSVSMQNAWLSARTLCQANEANLCDGRWRVLWNGQRVSEISGPSASGAATLGWYHSLNGTSYDRRVIVLAQVSKEGVFTEVTGVETKVRALAKAVAAGSWIDTVVVAGQRNEDDAVATLGLFGMSYVKVRNVNASRT